MYVLGLELEVIETALFCVIYDSVFGLNDVIRSPSYTPPSRRTRTTPHHTAYYNSTQHNAVQLNTF
jgi:hypothetical protein